MAFSIETLNIAYQIGKNKEAEGDAIKQYYEFLKVAEENRNDDNTEKVDRVNELISDVIAEELKHINILSELEILFTDILPEEIDD